MPSLTDYFDKVSYKPTYKIGDRVRGYFDGIPFAGSVAIDTLVEQDVGPYVIVFLDLPIKTETGFLTMIKVSHNNLLEKGASFGKSRNKKKS